jgi:hypothetical protein
MSVADTTNLGSSSLNHPDTSDDEERATANVNTAEQPFKELIPSAEVLAPQLPLERCEPTESVVKELRTSELGEFIPSDEVPPDSSIGRPLRTASTVAAPTTQALPSNWGAFDPPISQIESPASSVTAPDTLAAADTGTPSKVTLTTDQVVDVIDRPIHSQPALSRPNEYETLIPQDERSVVNDPLLLRTPYIVNTKYMALICMECGHAVDPDKASTHARQLHQGCKLPESFVVELKRRYSGLRAEKIHPGGIVPAVFGLAVPPKPFEVCSRCLRGYSNHSSFRKHVCENAQKDLQGEPPSFSSLVQTFFREPRICYFPIETPKAKEIDDDFAIFRSQFPNIDIVEDEIANPTDYRELDQFLCKEGWISHVAGYSRSGLLELTCSPRQDEILATISHEVYLLMSKIQSIIGCAGFHVRRLLGRRPSYVHLYLLERR